jgi:hypothetical protein
MLSPWWPVADDDRIVFYQVFYVGVPKNAGTALVLVAAGVVDSPRRAAFP